MFSYITKRLFSLVPILLGITFITFFLIKHIPGSPVYSLVGQRASPEIIKRYTDALGLNMPLWKQYTRYLWMILHGDLGYSYYTHISVSRLFWQKFPNTLRLAAAAMFMAVLGGLFLGIGAAVKRNTFIDRFIMFLSTCSISLPVFWWGIILIIVFAYSFRWFPASGMGGGALIYLILPAVTLGSRSMAYIARITRASMLNVFSQPYIQSAQGRGIGLMRLVIKHSLKNALIPIVTMIGLDIGSYLNGAVLTETVFSWDGIGRLAVTAIFKRDYPVILAVVLWGAAIFVLVNLAVDILYQFINPKVHYE